jgi:acyl carrier protein
MDSTVQEEATTLLSASVIDPLKAIVLDVLKLPLPPEALGEASNLYELGLESLNVVELLMAMEAAFDIVIDVEDLNGDIFSAFGRLAAFVQGKLDEAR